MKDVAVVYMVAGLSSRFGGKIKQFAQVGQNGETLIEYSINQAIKAGINKIVFIVGDLTKEQFQKKFASSHKEIKIEYALQTYDKKERDKPWGTLDAVTSIKNIVNCPFIICNGDDIYGENSFKTLVNHLKEFDTSATVSYKLIDVLPEKGKTNRGVFTIKDNKIIDLNEVFNIEKDNLPCTNSKEDDPISMNIFALYPQILTEVVSIVNKFKIDNKGNRTVECLLSKELGNLIKSNKLIMHCYPSKDKWFGVTNPEDEANVRQMLSNKE